MTNRGVFNILVVLFQVKIAIGQRKVKKMSIVRVGENENIDSALRRFKRKCSRDGIIGDLRKKEFYESPSLKRKKKSEAARKRSIKG